MSKLILCRGLAISLALCVAPPAMATDLEAPAPHRKTHHRQHHRWAPPFPPGPVLSLQVVREPSCIFGLTTRYPNYAKASCRDYDGVLTALDPGSPTGVGVYTFRAHYPLLLQRR